MSRATRWDAETKALLTGLDNRHLPFIAAEPRRDPGTRDVVMACRRTGSSTIARACSRTPKTYRPTICSRSLGKHPGNRLTSEPRSGAARSVSARSEAVPRPNFAQSSDSCILTTVAAQLSLGGNGGEPSLFFCPMADEVLKRMKARVAQCRRLAEATTDARAAKILRQMADEGEADIKRIELAQEG